LPFTGFTVVLGVPVTFAASEETFSWEDHFGGDWATGLCCCFLSEMSVLDLGLQSIPSSYHVMPDLLFDSDECHPFQSSHPVIADDLALADLVLSY